MLSAALAPYLHKVDANNLILFGIKNQYYSCSILFKTKLSRWFLSLLGRKAKIKAYADCIAQQRNSCIA